MGPLAPFWPKSKESRRGQGGSPPAPEARWVHLSQFWPQSQQSQKWPKGPQEPNFGNFQPLASGKHKRPPAQFWKVFPSIQGKTSPSPMYSVPNDPGMVHIWYNIPLCTNFAQQSNGDVLRTKLCLSNSSPQIHHPF
ncbi:hypothetical protein O181_004161 [Austropuccinia psidii MF-1]|uniref:Uncharacterized protein n=1 Tax=Austropuccinia psidii MF-1 TaxID=1389203 RepID=A0A9Q3BF14_9BASI|nr:hypothetical protein [Austropuccinia psidii MF-1]